MTTTMPREDESTQLAKRELARLEGKKSCIGFYDLEKTLGEGSFARVKAATHVLTGAKVAIKIVDKSKLNEDMSEKLRREVRIMKVLNHPHIVKLYEVIETQQEMFLVMEHAEGGELLDYLVAHGRMREKDARKMFRGIVSAIAYCHSKHVIHRDLKAENLLLDMGLNPKIADFGFSNIFSENGLLSTSCGTPAYAAPELFKGREYTGPEIDIWSLGVVLFVLVCGGLPFTASTFAALKARVIAGAFTVPVFMSTSCEELVRKMLETDPAKRITMDGVLKSAWFNDGYSPMEPFDEGTYAISPERHAAILGCMEELGFSRDRVEQSLESGAFNHFNATYHLLATEITPRIQREATEKPISHKHLEVTERRAAALAAKASQAQAAPVYATAVAAAGGAAAPTSPSTAAVAAPSTERNVVKRARGYTVNAVDANRIRKEMAIRKPSPLVPQKSDVQGSAPTSPQEGSSVPTSPTSPTPSPPLSPVSQSPSTAEPMNKIPKTDKGRRARAISLQPRTQRPVLSTLAPASPTTSTASTSTASTATASTATAEAATTSNASPPPSPRDHHMEDATTSTVTSKNAPHVSSPLNPKAATMAATLGGRPSQLRERRLSFKDKFKKTLGLSIKEPATSAEPPEPKTVRFHFSMQTTSAKAPAEIVGQLERVLDSFNVAYERENFLFLARKGSVAFELEVCKLPRLALHGVRIKRLAGDSWEYKAVCTDILLNLRL